MRILAHAHSDWSHDGTISLRDWEPLAAEAGFDAVLMTEHEETGWDPSRYQKYVAACGEHSSPRVRLLPGIEFLQNGVHVLCYGLQKYPQRPSTAAQLAEAVGNQNCGLCLAHPAKYGWQYSEELLRVVSAVEVWNSKWIYDGTWGPHPRSIQLARACGLQMFAGQDVHKPKHLSELALVTDSADYLRLLQEGRFRVMFERSAWPPDGISPGVWGGTLQRLRTVAVRRSLAVYRATKPLRQRRVNPEPGQFS